MPEPLDVAIGVAIRQRREALGLSQKALGDRCGLSFQQIQKYERGANRIAFSRLVPIAQGLGCRVAELIGELDTSEGLSPVRIEVLDLAEAPGAITLLRGYASLSGDYQRAVLELVRTVAFKGGAERPVVVSVFPSR